MDLDYMLSMLEQKDISAAFEALKELEKISDNSNILYPYMDQFIRMVSSEKYVIRVRGFRLLCKQSKWDVNNIMNENLQEALTILNDEKPTAVRQALAALQDVVRYKNELRALVKERITSIDYYRYKDSMHSLIAKDIQVLLSMIDEGEML